MIKVTVWNEYLHELQDEAVAKIYPEGIHKAIGSYLEGKNFEVTYATLREEHHGWQGTFRPPEHRRGC